MRLPTRRAILGTAIAAALPRPSQAAGTVLNDASQLNPTLVARHVAMRADEGAATIERLRAELRDAAAAGRPVAAGVARHSMGGQSLPREGTALTFQGTACQPDRAAGTYRVAAGARWRDVIAALDPIGFSPAVMQSNNDFGVCSAFSVNAHGWPVPHGPVGSTVRALRLMLADGSVVTCSRQENAELFRHAMGGYGLFGLILDMDVEMVPNAALTPTFEPAAAADIAARLVAAARQPGVGMAYARLDVARAHLLERGLVVSYRPAAPHGSLPPAHPGTVGPALARQVYRGEVGSDFGKRFRWFMETTVGPRISGGVVTRNSLLNESVSVLAGHDRRRTDILHEYFLPPDGVPAFLQACREAIPASRQDFLNVTLRYVAADRDSVLAYAPAARVAAVLSFSQAKTSEAEADMRRLTQALTGAALALGGSFYLPYRLHADPRQVAQAYPGLAGFMACKGRYDPGHLFRNALWDCFVVAA